MRVLVTNDDGIYARGLWLLAEALAEVGEVVVVAPDREQSGVGTSVTLHNPVRLHLLKSPIPGIPTFSVGGTPADSVILALSHLFKDRVEMVVAGINEGANLGNDVYISGTVGAAFQGYFYGLPSLAISVTALENPLFEPAARLAVLLVKELAKGTLPRELLLNINIPNHPPEGLQGMEVTRLGKRSYADDVQEGHDGRRRYYWIVRGRPQWNPEPGTDIWAVLEKRVSITPLGSPADSLIPTLQELCPDLFRALTS